MAYDWNASLQSAGDAISAGLGNAINGAVAGAASAISKPYQQPTPTSAAPGAPLSAPNVQAPVDATPWGKYALFAVGAVAIIYIAVKVVK